MSDGDRHRGCTGRIGRVRCALWTAALLAACALAGCNSPYPDSEEGQNILYETFAEEPKHLDPAQSYSTNESAIMCQIIEPPFQYHFLKRPYELVPLTAEAIPKAEKETIQYGGKSIDATVYTVRVQPDIWYQEHPCFVPANRRLTDEDVGDARSVWDVPARGTRPLVAGDYVYAIRRLADPRLACPIFSTLARNMLGIDDYQKALQAELDKQRQVRKDAAGALYNREMDEKYNPIGLDYNALAKGYPFVRRVDDRAFKVYLRRPYPQMLYWMAMAFFAAVPLEAIEFFDQRVMLERNILFDKNPVGTGPYVLREYDPTNQIVLQRNPRFRKDLYPTLAKGPDGDEAAAANYKEMETTGMLRDAGRPLPMIDRIVLRMEKESIPRWNKFLQGYYDSSGITSDLFDQAVTLTSRGESELTDDLGELDIRLLTSYSTTVSYSAFNMADPVVGGYTDDKRKLRKAISIAFNIEDDISIFFNGRGLAAQSPIPPGIFGYETGRAGMNPFVYTWDEKRQRGVRKSIEAARKLLSEAGYHNGFDRDGKQLAIRFATTADTAADRAQVMFARKQFEKLNIYLDIESTDYNQFRDKVRAGNFQFLRWGWVADYPDPENFLFLLYGPNGKIKAGGENVANYDSKAYNELFARMESMENTPERLEIIRKMIRILQNDAPWIFGFYPVAYGLYHEWYTNTTPHGMAFNTFKYRRIDPARRTVYRKRHNQPRWMPVIVFLGLLVAASVPAVWVGVKHFREA